MRFFCQFFVESLKDVYGESLDDPEWADVFFTSIALLQDPEVGRLYTRARLLCDQGFDTVGLQEAKACSTSWLSLNNTLPVKRTPVYHSLARS